MISPTCRPLLRPFLPSRRKSSGARRRNWLPLRGWTKLPRNAISKSRSNAVTLAKTARNWVMPCQKWVRSTLCIWRKTKRLPKNRRLRGKIPGSWRRVVIPVLCMKAVITPLGELLKIRKWKRRALPAAKRWLYLSLCPKHFLQISLIFFLKVFVIPVLINNLL